MATYVCDGCEDEPGTYMVSNTENGQTQAFGMLCLTLLGVTTLFSADVTALDEVVKALGYMPSPAEKKRRKEADGPEFDAGRTIAEVVESAPRPPGDESVEPQGDESADHYVDNFSQDGGDTSTSLESH